MGVARLLGSDVKGPENIFLNVGVLINSKDYFQNPTDQSVYNEQNRYKRNTSIIYSYCIYHRLSTEQQVKVTVWLNRPRLESMSVKRKCNPYTSELRLFPGTMFH